MCARFCFVSSPRHCDLVDAPLDQQTLSQNEDRMVSYAGGGAVQLSLWDLHKIQCSPRASPKSCVAGFRRVPCLGPWRQSGAFLSLGGGCLPFFGEVSEV